MHCDVPKSAIHRDNQQKHENLLRVGDSFAIYISGRIVEFWFSGKENKKLKSEKGSLFKKWRFTIHILPELQGGSKNYTVISAFGLMWGSEEPFFNISHNPKVRFRVSWPYWGQDLDCLGNLSQINLFSYFFKWFDFCSYLCFAQYVVYSSALETWLPIPKHKNCNVLVHGQIW